MVSNWLTHFLGYLGTAVLLIVAGISYFIWRFNPVFRIPERKPKSTIPITVDNEQQSETADVDEPAVPTRATAKQNGLKKGASGVMVIMPDSNRDQMPPLELIEKQQDQPVFPADLDDEENMSEKFTPEPGAMKPVAIESPFAPVSSEGDIQLEIKAVPTTPIEEEITAADKSAELEPYEPTLDLRNYKYPSLDLLETHGSEKIMQDPAELEANKNQIINTLKNYDIAIQKIFATVGPTVTLYEIVPAPGVRISRIKNLEDDIALSLAALGIRIIAPIPGKGTIGIEVPNVKKQW